MTKKQFYTFMACVMIGLFGKAVAVSMDLNRRQNFERLKLAETLSYEECARRYYMLLEEFRIRPTSGKMYYAVHSRAYALSDSALKAIQNPPPLWVNGKRRDFRMDEVVRDIPVGIQTNLIEYEKTIGPIQDTQEFWDAGQEFAASGSNPIHRQNVHVPGGDRVIFWWLAFQFWPSILIAVHFCIRLREQGQKIFPEFGNPEFWFWALFWEVGLFRYPVKVSPAQQIRRLKKWGALVFTTVLPCMAGTGKPCEEKQTAPQHQLYKGARSRFLSRISFTTVVLPKYIGLDGGDFFDAPVVQSTATVTFPCGFFVGVFYSEPLGNRFVRPNFGRELDPYAGWKRTVGKYTFDASFTYLFVSPIRQIPRGDVVQLSERITRKMSLGSKDSFSPFVWLRQAMPVRVRTPIGGNFEHFGGMLSHGFGERVSVAVTAEIVRDSGAFGFREGYIGRLGGGINWQGKHGVSFQIPQVMFSDPVSHTEDGRRRELTVGVGMSFSPKR